jgi:undecaprenyl-phosphate 4-deoxy-4-formamido-L-arabinose transferase
MENDAEKVDISVVVPFFNEEAALPELSSRLLATLEGLERSFEVVFVDDGSTDRGLEILRELRSSDKRVRIIRLTRNFGQSPALYAGFSMARGRYVLMIDADLQNAPEDLPKLVEKLDEGFDIVSGWRQQREDSRFRNIASRLLNRIIARITRVPLHDYGCALKGFRREVVTHMNLLTHRNRYLPVDAACLGGRVAEVPVQHGRRTAGGSKYSLLKLIRTAFDLITSITSAPLQFIGLCGWVFAFAGFAMAIRVIWYRIFAGDVMKIAAVVAAFFFLAGVQMIATGLMCEYIGRIYIEVQQKPYYVIHEELD